MKELITFTLTPKQASKLHKIVTHRIRINTRILEHNQKLLPNEPSEKTANQVIESNGRTRQETELLSGISTELEKALNNAL